MEKITAVLITTEKNYPQKVWERLDQNFFDEILVRTESPSVYERYLLASTARNPICYVQDDDCILNFQNLYKHYNGHITNAMPKEFLAKYAGMGCTLVGWGCYFQRPMLQVFNKYIERYGEDAHLLREADRIFTYLNRPFNTVIMPHQDLPRATADVSMWKDPNHFKSAEEALRKCSLL